MSVDFLRVNYDSETKIWKSQNDSYENLTNRSLSEAFLQSMRSLDAEKVLEYHYDVDREKCVKDLYHESISVARNLQCLGLKKGDVVLLFSGYNYWTSSFTFGTLLMGGVVNYFEVQLENENIDELFDVIQPFMILYECEFLEKIQQSLKRQKPKSLKHIFAIDSFQEENDLNNPLASNRFIDFDKFEPIKIEDPELEVAFLVLTSGSTGLPKVTQLTHCLLLNSVYIWWANNYNYEPVNSNSLLFSLSPLRWISQVVLLLQSAILGIKRICSNKSATTHYGLEILRKTKPTHIFSVPPFFHGVLKELKENDQESLNSLKYIQLGGEHPSSVIINLARKYCVNSRLFFSYGMSEVSGSITNDEFISGGKLQPGFEMQVLDEELKPLDHNQQGKLAIKTPYPFVGYKGEENKKYFLDNGFFLNGDYGFFDHNNTLHFLARIKDLINFQNVLIIPNLVESLVLKIPEVSAACLVGYHGSEVGPNEKAALFVILKKDTDAIRKEMDLKIREIWSLHLSDDQRLLIRNIYFKSRFPLTTCGKINRITLSDYARIMGGYN